ncbi:MAG: sialidase family protein [Gemmatimonadota bacterium]
MCVALLGGGRVVAFRAWGGEPREDGTYAGRLSRSFDGGTTWTHETVPVAMPAGAKPYTHRSLVALPDGTLLCTYYSHRPGQWKAYCGLLRSPDGGQTWAHFADIADDPEAPLEGYDEPAMIRLANGDLLSLLRTGGPICQTRSRDDGRTWGPPVEVGDHGVCPDLCLMQSGILVASYGRPNAGIMLSFDRTGERCEEAQDLYRGPGSSYTTIREVEPGLLAYYYGQSGFIGTGGPGPLNEIRVAHLRIQSR